MLSAAFALSVASSSFSTMMSPARAASARPQPGLLRHSLLRHAHICSSESTLRDAVRSAALSKEECVVEAESAAEQRACNDPVLDPSFFPLPKRKTTRNPFPSMDSWLAPSLHSESLEECLTEADSFMLVQDCRVEAARAKGARVHSHSPAAYPSEWRGPLAKLRGAFSLRLQCTDKFPSPWFPATLAGTMAVGRALARRVPI